jgi:hypothetical protein
VPLEVSAPFHCSLMAPAAAVSWRRGYAATTFAPPTLQVIANVSADAIGSGDEARALLERQVTGSVRWVETLERLHAAGCSALRRVRRRQRPHRTGAPRAPGRHRGRGRRSGEPARGARRLLAASRRQGVTTHDRRCLGAAWRW